MGRMVLFLALGMLVSGCVSWKWQPSWSAARAANPTAASKELMVQARDAYNRANTRTRLLESIVAHFKVLAEDPGNREALTMLGNQYILLGTAYTDSRSEKSRLYRLAMQYCEWAMYTNLEFKAAVDSGKKPWEALEALGEDDAPAMLFWVTALQYEFKEGMTIVGKVVNVHWMQECLLILNRIEKVAPDFGGGAVEFAKTICYFALPASKGGNKELGDQYMQRSMQKQTRWLFARWARGKYFNDVTGNSTGREEDLRWVVSQNPGEFLDPYPWRVHFQDDARAILGNE